MDQVQLFRGFSYLLTPLCAVANDLDRRLAPQEKKEGSPFRSEGADETAMSPNYIVPGKGHHRVHLATRSLTLKLQAKVGEPDTRTTTRAVVESDPLRGELDATMPPTREVN